ncbi:TrkH family potassium uptake protein [Rhizobiaceae bacterium]|nr:TrkH family potassium uptake protein [Rhizobiaceae bacterium]
MIDDDEDEREVAFNARSQRSRIIGFVHVCLAGLFRMSPPSVLLVLYSSLVVVGAGILKLPFAAVEPTSWSDALFTSASAVTVTGLTVLDTGSHFTGFGQAVIALLIQLGGLGLMSFAVLILSALGMQVGLPRSVTLREDLGQTSLNNLGRLVKLIAVVFIVAEVAGTGALAFVFVPEHGWATGLWHALFHTISAFNNAGFALYPDNMVSYALDPTMNVVLPALFIAGGLGFVVIADLWQHRRWSPLMLHSKLMLVGTAALIVWGVGTFAALEWTNPGTLGLYDSWQDKMTVAWFQGVTPRTAGFNTVDYAAMHDSTTLMSIMLMLIGGGATSTAGGIKVTTFIVLLLATVAFFRGRSQPVAFGRAIPIEDVLRVTALICIVILFVTVSTFVILISHDGDLTNLLFEVVSAFGTVGLSRGATTELDGVGRTVIVLLMFAGRVGPLTLGFFLATRSAPRVQYPKGPVYLG